MKKRMLALYTFGAVVIFSSVIIAGGLSLLGDTPSVKDKPSAELLEAALASQISRASVDITYTRMLNEKSEMEFRYVRTPEIQYLSTGTATKGGFCLFDRKHVKGKQFIVDAGKKKGTIQADVSGMPLETAGCPDPALSVLQTGMLVDIIGKGTVADAMEKVDRHDCWRVDIKKYTGKMAIEVTVWVDPSIGFCPRRIETKWPTHLMVCTMTDYKDLGNDVWFPMNVRWESTDSDWQASAEAKVKNASLVSDFNALKLDTAFPSGTKVQDVIMGAKYTVP